MARQNRREFLDRLGILAGSGFLPGLAFSQPYLDVRGTGASGTLLENDEKVRSGRFHDEVRRELV